MTRSLLAARRGSQTPRVANYPRYAYSDADEVIELYEAVVGRPLDPWQKLVLRHGLGKLSPEQWAAFKVACWVARQNGKGDIILALELAWLFLPGFQVRLVTHSAHLYSTAQEAFLRLKDVLEGSDDLRPSIKAIRETNGEQGIILRTGQRLKFMARTRTGGRGFSAPRVVLDEAQELQDLMMASALPTMSAQPDPQVWFFGTPPDDPTAWAYNLKADGEAGTPDLAWFDWGADLSLENPEDRARVGDPDLWYACNPALGVRITERFVESELRPSGLGELFPYERLGVWRPRATGGAGVIPEQLWRDQVCEPERPSAVALCVQVNYQRSRAAIMAVGPRADGRLVTTVVDYRPGTHWVVERAAELKARWNPIGIAVQEKGPTGALLEDMAKAGLKPAENRDEPKRGDLAIPWADDVADAYGMWIDALVQQRLFHFDEAPLNLAITTTGTRSLSGATAWDYKGENAAPLLGSTLALWLWLTWADKVTAQYDPLANIW